MLSPFLTALLCLSAAVLALQVVATVLLWKMYRRTQATALLALPHGVPPAVPAPGTSPVDAVSAANPGLAAAGMTFVPVAMPAGYGGFPVAPLRPGERIVDKEAEAYLASEKARREMGVRSE